MWQFKVKLITIKQNEKFSFLVTLATFQVPDVASAYHTGQCRYKPLSHHNRLDSAALRVLDRHLIDEEAEPQ